MSEYLLVVLLTGLGAVGIAAVIWFVAWILEKIGL